MSKMNKKKKSTTKESKPDTSKLIPIIAIVEVLVLIAVSTFAWFYMAKNKKLSSGIITVQADSGLEIDFNDADKSSYIDIFNYIDKDTFYFEPATSVDGRNIYFPTTGTFGNDQTEKIKFREGTVNDINSKYINIDFELTNNSNQEMEVFLSNNSQFKVTDKNNNKVNGKALRLAFYNNDGNSGNVSSSFADKFKSSDIVGTGSSSDPDEITVYFYRNTNTWAGVDTVYAYLYDSTSPEQNVETVDGKSITFDNSGYSQAYPGQACSWVSGNVYSYTFSNPYKTKTISEYNDQEGENEDKVYKSSSLRRFDTIIFSDGTSNKQSHKLKITNNMIYNDGLPDGSTGGPVTFKTVYFLSPKDWGTPKCAVKISATGTWYAEGDTGYDMKKVGAGVYSYTFPEKITVENVEYAYDTVQFFNKSNTNDHSLTASLTDEALYYFPSGYNDGTLSSIQGYSNCNLYFYNSLGWSQPYVNINAMADSYDFTKYTYSLPMINLTGGLYYIEVPSVFMNDKMLTAAPSLASNCVLTFSENENGGGATTSQALSQTNYIYKPTGASSPYSLNGENYSSQLDISEKPYAVISPGVSAGFQRSANPVKTIDDSTGDPLTIVPTFASAFDDYIMGSNNPVFRIDSKQTVNMSMIIWLEGTDEHCVEENYAGNNINLYLEFSTLKQMDATDETYTYRFTDATEELWTSNTVTSAAGVEVNPVMQMYDVTAERGYIMSGKSFSSYKNENKVRDWECLAPQTILNSGHEIEFRRVNPYNESEVWNVWQAGNITEYKQDSYNSTNRVVTFTAFADGSPDYARFHNKFHNDDENSDIPQKSCGGIWGAVSTQMLYLYDGRKERNIEKDMTGGDKEKGYLYCHYSYTYPQSGETVTLEYKGSTNNNAFFSFVVPQSIYSSKPEITFPNYVVGNKDIAVNAKEQTTIWLRHVYAPGRVAGQFYALNSSSGGVSYQDSYWGSDAIYVQATNTLGHYYNNEFAFYQIYFHGTNGTRDFYSYMYENDNYKGSNTNTSFVAIVPAGGSFDFYRFEAAKHSNHDQKIRYDLGEHSITHTTDSNGLSVNTVTPVDGAGDGRILWLDWDWAEIYYRGNGSWNDANDWVYNPSGNDAGDYVTVYHSGGGTGNGDYNMEWDSTDSVANRQIVRGYVPSNSTIQFKFNKASSSQHTHSGHYSANGMDGHIFVPEAYDDGTSEHNIYCASYGGMGSNMSYYGTYTQVGTSQHDNSSWPEYKPESNYDPRNS